MDAFTIIRIAGQSSITVSQRYVHPTPEAVERAFERLQLSGKWPTLELEAKVQRVTTNLTTVRDSVAVSH